MTDLDLNAGFDSIAARVRDLSSSGAPPSDDWRNCVTDLLADLEWIVARDHRWPDAGLRARTALSSLAGLFLAGKDVEEAFMAGATRPSDPPPQHQTGHEPGS